MIVKGTKQLGSFKRGVNIYVPKKKVIVPAAPSGIVAATAGNLIITFADQSFITYNKFSNSNWAYFNEGEPSYRLAYDFWKTNEWTLTKESEFGSILVQAENSFTGSSTIPIDGWFYTIDNGSSVTITAA
jgi:hypothetical protein